MLRPELQQQWHVERNMHLGPLTIKPYSQIRAVWQCLQCPAGQPRIWTGVVTHRKQRSAQCPYCTNKLLCLHNSLATVAPNVAEYWDHSKNEKAPQQVLAGSKSWALEVPCLQVGMASAHYRLCQCKGWLSQVQSSSQG